MALRVNDFTAYRTLLSNLLQNEGIPGLFKGLGPNISGIFIYKGVSFFFYEHLKDWIHVTQYVAQSHFKEFVSAGIASISAQTLTYPFDVLKRRYMVQKDRQHQFAHQPHK